MKIASEESRAMKGEGLVIIGAPDPAFPIIFCCMTKYPKMYWLTVATHLLMILQFEQTPKGGGFLCSLWRWLGLEHPKCLTHMLAPIGMGVDGTPVVGKVSVSICICLYFLKKKIFLYFIVFYLSGSPSLHQGSCTGYALTGFQENINKSGQTLQLAEYHFCHILLVKTSQKWSPNSKGEETASTSWWKEWCTHIEMGGIAGCHHDSQSTTPATARPFSSYMRKHIPHFA